MIGFKDYINESEDMIGYHGKVVPIKTDHFEGNAHISFDSIKRGKHKTHSYRVEYKGKGGFPGSEKEDVDMTNYMDVYHNNGSPYSHKLHPVSSKDLNTALHKAAPRWVRVKDLQL